MLTPEVIAQFRNYVLVLCSEREEGTPRRDVLGNLTHLSWIPLSGDKADLFVRRTVKELVGDGDILQLESKRLLTDKDKHPQPWREGNAGREANRLLANAKQKLPELRKMLEESSDHWGYEDPVYRYYHHSFKVLKLQSQTHKIVNAFHALAPHLPLNEDFLQIMADGTGDDSWMERRANSPDYERRLVEAFFHARFMLEMICKYSAKLKVAPRMLPSGWAAVLYLYNLR